MGNSIRLMLMMAGAGLMIVAFAILIAVREVS
jgi:hypothetical protein